MAQSHHKSWHVKIEASLTENGQSGTISLEAKDLQTLVAVAAEFERALRMCKALRAEPVPPTSRDLIPF